MSKSAALFGPVTLPLAFAVIGMLTSADASAMGKKRAPEEVIFSLAGTYAIEKGTSGCPARLQVEVEHLGPEVKGLRRLFVNLRDAANPDRYLHTFSDINQEEKGTNFYIGGKLRIFHEKTWINGLAIEHRIRSWIRKRNSIFHHGPRIREVYSVASSKDGSELRYRARTRHSTEPEFDCRYRREPIPFF